MGYHKQRIMSGAYLADADVAGQCLDDIIQPLARHTQRGEIGDDGSRPVLSDEVHQAGGGLAVQQVEADAQTPTLCLYLPQACARDDRYTGPGHQLYRAWRRPGLASQLGTTYRLAISSNYVCSMQIQRFKALCTKVHKLYTAVHFGLPFPTYTRGNSMPNLSYIEEQIRSCFDTVRRQDTFFFKEHSRWA